MPIRAFAPRAAHALLAAFVLAACGTATTETPDAGDENPVDAGKTDAGTPDSGTPDAGPALSTIGAACASDNDCSATEDAVCLDEPNDGFRAGYCDYEPGCARNADCPAGSHCAYIQNGSGYCLKSCASAADCRSDGYACADFDDNGSKECDRSATGASKVGGACEHYWDCSGGIDGDCASEARDGNEGGYCIIHRCTATAGCPEGSHCGFIDGTSKRGQCIANCAANADCRATGYACFDADSDSKKECWRAGTGTGKVGAACEGSSDCAGGERGSCLRAAQTDHKDGYCSMTCSATAACPSGSHCANKDTDGNGVCQADCANTTDCRGSGYLCADADGDGSKECAAAGTGTGKVGAKCDGVWDCAGGVYALCLGETNAGVAGGYCSFYCIEDTRCGAGAHCAYVGDDGGYCFKDCEEDLECRVGEGYACDDGDGDDVTECTPP